MIGRWDWAACAWLSFLMGTLAHAIPQWVMRAEAEPEAYVVNRKLALLYEFATLRISGWNSALTQCLLQQRHATGKQQTDGQ